MNLKLFIFQVLIIPCLSNIVIYIYNFSHKYLNIFHQPQVNARFSLLLDFYKFLSKNANIRLLYVKENTVRYESMHVLNRKNFPP